MLLFTVRFAFLLIATMQLAISKETENVGSNAEPPSSANEINDESTLPKGKTDILSETETNDAAEAEAEPATLQKEARPATEESEVETEPKEVEKDFLSNEHDVTLPSSGVPSITLKSGHSSKLWITLFCCVRSVLGYTGV